MSSSLEFNRVYRLEIQSVSHVSIFDLAFCVILPPNLLSSSQSKSHYLHTVCGLEGVGGVELCWRPYSARV
jgi:hypothetical protein